MWQGNEEEQDARTWRGRRKPGRDGPTVGRQRGAANRKPRDPTKAEEKRRRRKERREVKEEGKRATRKRE